MKQLITIACFICLLLISVTSYCKEYVVRKVIDGNTIQLENGKIVKYQGIDAPEMYVKNSGGGFFSRESAKQNKKLVFLKKVRLEFDVEEKDNRGRLLAYVFVKNLFVNGELVKLGCAKVTAKPPNTKYKELLLKNRKMAMEEERGIWQEKKRDSEGSYIGNKRTYTLHRPSCKNVTKIPDKNKIIFRNRLDAIKIGYIPDKHCKP